MRPSQFICSGIHSERDCEQHTKQAWAPLRSENVLGSPTFLSHLAKKNKPTKAGFEVCTIWAIRRWDLWANGSNLHVGPPFTTFDKEQEMAKALQEMASPLRQQSLIITKHCVPTVNKVEGRPTWSFNTTTGGKYVVTEGDLALSGEHTSNIQVMYCRLVYLKCI